MEGSTPTQFNAQDIVFKNIDCPIHQGEPIVSINQNAISNSLICFGCFMNEGIDKNDIITLEKFREFLTKLFQQMNNLKSDTNFDFQLIESESTLKELEQKFEEKKQFFNKKLEYLKECFNEKCEIAKKKVFASLDSNIQNIKTNIKFYNNAIKLYSGKDSNAFQSLLTEFIINNKYETKNSIVSQILNFKELDSYIQSSQSLDKKTIFEKLKYSISYQLQSISGKSESINETVKIIDKVQVDLDKHFEPLGTIRQDIELLPISRFFNEINQSKILRGDKLKQFNKLTEKQFSAPVKYKLLYRGSEDGFAASAFHKKCDNIHQTLTIAKVENDEIFGGYADKKWNSGSGHISSNQCWVFSLYHKNIYKNQNNDQSIYCNPIYGPIFGANDLYISDNCDKNSNSTSNLGASYENDSKSSLGSQRNFIVKDYEVYKVEFL